MRPLYIGPKLGSKNTERNEARGLCDPKLAGGQVRSVNEQGQGMLWRHRFLDVQCFGLPSIGRFQITYPMGFSPKFMPANTDGQAHLFFAGTDAIQIMAVSTTGCIAIQTPDNPVRVFKWYFRAKGRELITLSPHPWLILWSCRAPWNTERCGHVSRLDVNPSPPHHRAIIHKNQISYQ